MVDADKKAILPNSNGLILPFEAVGLKAEEKKAVKELKNIVKDKHGDPLLQAAVSTIIGTLVSIDEQLALKALSEIEGACVTEKCGKEIEKAYKELGKAAEEIAKEHWDHVIDKYKKAWEHTQHAVKENIP